MILPRSGRRWDHRWLKFIDLRTRCHGDPFKLVVISCRAKKGKIHFDECSFNLEIRRDDTHLMPLTCWANDWGHRWSWIICWYGACGLPSQGQTFQSPDTNDLASVRVSPQKSHGSFSSVTNVGDRLLSRTPSNGKYQRPLICMIAHQLLEKELIDAAFTSIFVMALVYSNEKSAWGKMILFNILKWYIFLQNAFLFKYTLHIKKWGFANEQNEINGLA